MPNELNVVPLVALLDAVHTDGVAVCCVTGVTPDHTEGQNKETGDEPNEFHPLKWTDGSMNPILLKINTNLLEKYRLNIYKSSILNKSENQELYVAVYQSLPTNFIILLSGILHWVTRSIYISRYVEISPSIYPDMCGDLSIYIYRYVWRSLNLYIQISPSIYPDMCRDLSIYISRCVEISPSIYPDV